MSSSTSPEKLHSLQRRFADHLRNPDRVTGPEGVEDRRLAVYRRLVFNNLDNLFARNFPVLRRMLDDAAWQALVRDFMIEHRPTTPLFTEIGGEFVRYLEQTRTRQPQDPHWMIELAHWEYLETTVRLHEADPAAVPVDPTGSLLDHPTAINPTLAMARYHWPVHRISPKFRPASPLKTPIWLLAWRQLDEKVAFMKVNERTAALINELRQSKWATGREVFAALADALGQPATTVLNAAKPMLQTLQTEQVILGPCRLSAP